MPKTYRIPFPSAEPGQIRFSSHCVCCGLPAQATSNLVVTRQVKRKRKQETEILHYPIPHCEQCHRGSKATFLAGLLPFAAGFILLGGAAFLITMFYAVDQGIDQNTIPGSNNSTVVGGAVGLIIGMLGGFLFELLARLLLLPIFGKALWQAPLLLTQFMRDSDYVAGVEGRLDRPSGELLLTFNREDLAEPFGIENPAAQPVNL